MELGPLLRLSTEFFFQQAWKKKFCNNFAPSDIEQSLDRYVINKRIDFGGRRWWQGGPSQQRGQFYQTPNISQKNIILKDQYLCKTFS